MYAIFVNRGSSIVVWTFFFFKKKARQLEQLN